MIGGLTDYAANRKLDCLFGGVPLVSPKVLYVGLSLARPNKLGTVAEPVAGGYARVAVPNDPAHFPAAHLGVKANATPIAFPAPTADWGRVLCVFVADAPKGGNVIAMCPVAMTGMPILAGDPPPTIAPGAFYLSDT